MFARVQYAVKNYVDHRAVCVITMRKVQYALRVYEDHRAWYCDRAESKDATVRDYLYHTQNMLLRKLPCKAL